MKRVVLILLLSVWTVLTWHRAGEWSSNLRLWRSAVQVTPCLPRVHVNLAEALASVAILESQREMATAQAIVQEGQCLVLR
jgi:hypothetical protein